MSIKGRLKTIAKALTQSQAERRHSMVGPGHLWKMKRDFQIAFLKERGLAPGHRLLDIGCGTLRGGMPLIEYLDAGHYYGVEVDEAALDEGRKELVEAGQEAKRPTLLLCPDIAKLEIDCRFDFIWAFSVLIHMSDPILDGALGFVSRHLSDGGTLYANVDIGETGEITRWRSFPVVRRTLQVYQETCARHGLGVTDIGPLRDHGHLSGSESQDDQRMLRIVKEPAAE